ncbi:MAG: 16S rRNA (guanine(527)-N(7))-methyltransferase RsmG [Anaerolineales bacterium]
MKRFAQEAYDLLSLRLSPAQLSAFETYEKQLIQWNQHINLTAITDPQKIRHKHFLDSLTCWLVMRGSKIDRVVDVGTGAGFPGIPLKIVFPSIQLTLVESIGKKADFCRQLLTTLGLQSVDVLKERVEIVATIEPHRQNYDWAIARAVAPMPVLMEYLLPLVKIGGKALAMKGESGPVEAHEAEYAIRILGGRLQQIIPVSLPGVEEDRYLITVEKIAATPDQYPRRVGRPQKKPLTGER